jgi:hypothetical protein
VYFNKLYTCVPNFEMELLAVWCNSEAPMTQNSWEVSVEEEDIFPAIDLTGLIAPTRYVAQRGDLDEEEASIGRVVKTKKKINTSTTRLE